MRIFDQVGATINLKKKKARQGNVFLNAPRSTRFFGPGPEEQGRCGAEKRKPQGPPPLRLGVKLLSHFLAYSILSSTLIYAVIMPAGALLFSLRCLVFNTLFFLIIYVLNVCVTQRLFRRSSLTFGLKRRLLYFQLAFFAPLWHE